MSLDDVVSTFPVLQAHRGYHQHAVENTLDALEQAKKVHFRACEFDVRLTGDGEIVLHHDANLMRIYRSKQVIRHHSWSDLKAFGLTRLVDVLDSSAVPEYLNIEIKNESFFNFDLEERLVQLLRNHRFPKKILLSSFNPLSLMYFQHRLPGIPRAQIVNLRKSFHNPIYLRQMWFDSLLHSQFLHIDYQSYSRGIVFANQLKQRRVAVWTVNDVSLTQSLLQHGVRSVISDDVTPQMLPEMHQT